MDVIDINVILEQVICDTFTKLAEQITGIEFCLVKDGDDTIKSASDAYSAVILSKGAVRAKIVCTLPKSLFDQMLLYMNHGISIEKEEEREYYKEFLNMVFGRIISRVNDIIGKPSRFMIPIIIRGIYHDSGIGWGGESKTLEFKCDYGTIRMDINHVMEWCKVGAENLLERGETGEKALSSR